jgi:NADPH:quinone reductase-like Zn-dependent oxidoreductase
MKTVSVLGPGADPAGTLHAEVVDVAGAPVRFALVEVPEPDFDPASAAHRGRVLVRSRAFCLNFRDKALVLLLARQLPEGGFRAVGSEFVGEVVACGDDVTTLAPGDRVIANSSYPSGGAPGAGPGLTTQEGSSQLFVAHPQKLCRIPPAMDDTVAAAFTVGAQTVYSMLRRAEVKDGDRVLVTAGTSNTSLFAIEALRHRDVKVWATTTSARGRERLEALGLSGGVFQIDPKLGDLSEDARVAEVARSVSGFSVVVDPYSDMYLGRVLTLMPFFGRYVMCGFYDQYLGLVGKRFEYRGQGGPAVLTMMMVKNLSLIGNCLGSRDDLERGLADHAAGRLAVHVDSVHRGDAVGDFVRRSFEDPDRFGKVVYSYT